MNRIVLTFALLISFCLQGQDLFVKSYSTLLGQQEDLQIEILNTNEIVVVGQTNPINNQNKIFIKKLNACGQILWQKEIEADSQMHITQLNIDSNQNILLSGQYDQTNSSPTAYLIKYDQSGNLIYSKLISNNLNRNSLHYSTSIAANGDYLMYIKYNYTPSPPNNHKTTILRLSEDGTVLWAKNYDIGLFQWGKLIATKDNGAICRISNDIFTIDSLGVVKWAKKYNSLWYYAPIIETDSNFVIFNTHIGAIDRAFGIGLNKKGEIKWTTTLFHNFLPTRGIQRKNGNLLYTGKNYFNGISMAFTEIDPSIGTIERFQQTSELNGITASDIVEDDFNNIFLVGPDNRGLLPQLIVGKLNDTLSTVNCLDSNFQFSTGAYPFNFNQNLNFTSTANTDLFTTNFSITEATSSLVVNSTECSFQRNRGDYKLGNDTIICPNQSITLGNNSNSFDAYKWSTGATSKTIQVSSPGEYHLMVVAACDTLRDTIQIDYYPIIGLDLGPDSILCATDSIVLGSGLSFNNYLWSNGSNSPTITVNSIGLYWLEVSTNCGVVRDTVLIKPPPNLLIPSLIDDTTLCHGDSIHLFPGRLINYLWSNGENSPSIEVKNSGLYWVETSNGCEAIRDSVNVDYYPEISIQYHISNTHIQTFEIIELENLTPNITQSVWEFGNGDSIHALTTTYTYHNAGSYNINLFVHILNGCTATKDIPIQVRLSDFFAPTVFTPNGDEVNDEFFPVGNDIKYFNMKIFNRWGTQVFSGENSSWDGRYSGENAKEGMYTYEIQLTLTNNQQMSLNGNVTLLR